MVKIEEKIENFVVHVVELEVSERPLVVGQKTLEIRPGLRAFGAGVVAVEFELL